MCNFFEDKFEQINKLKYLMTLAGNDKNFKIYKTKIEDIFQEFENFNTRNEEKDMLILTPEELASFNGENRKVAYIAIDGVIYDVTNIELFKKRPHKKIKLGKDLTEEFNKCHGGNLSLLSNIPKVGLLAEPEEVEFMEDSEEYYPQKRFKIMSSEELKKYNGQNGNPSYIAIDGIVYDVSVIPFLRMSPHDKLSLGTDITKEFNECYKGNKDYLRGLPIVAILHDFKENKRGMHIQTISKDLTLRELEKYDGENRNPAYIAIDGVIYDVSNTDLFKESPYNKLKLGSDVTSEFNECNSGDKSVLVRLPIVGTLIYDNKSYPKRNKVKEFNINDLNKYNGKNGNPPYISIFGTVYDLTDVEGWKEKNIKVGCDLTGEYKEVYGNNKKPLKNLSIAGVLTCSYKDC